MPALPSVPNVLKCSVQHTISGVPAFVHLYLRYSGTAPAATDAAAIANSIKSAWSTNFTSLASPSCILTLVQVTDLSSPTGAQNQSSGTVTGTRVGAPMAASACVLINQHITRRYRGGKPREYWPFGVSTDLQTAQTWATAFQTSMASAYNAFIAACTAITWAGASIAGPVNVSYFQGFTVVTNPSTGRAHNVPKLRTGGPVVDTIASASVNPRVATQRRRQHFSA